MAQSRDHPFPELWLRFRELRVVESPGHMNRAQNIAWLPPECPEGFETVGNVPWHVFQAANPQAGRPNRIRPASDARGNHVYTLPAHVELHDTASLFFSTELNSFLEVPYDCTRDHVIDRRGIDERDGWTRPTFRKIEHQIGNGDHPPLWMIGHALGKNQIDADVYISDSWNELLLPGCFSNGVYRRNTQPTCELAGKFTMIFGVVAFATTLKDLIPMIKESFRHQGTTHYRPTWETNRSKDLGRKCSVVYL